MIHHTIVCTLSVAVVIATLFGFAPGTVTQSILLALGVAVVGLPHGSLDHEVGRKLLQPRMQRWWAVGFLACYGGLLVLTLIAWFLTPLLTLSLFLAVSAWHFGKEDLCGLPMPRWSRLPTQIVTGGVIIWVPLLVHPKELLMLFGWIAPVHMDLPLFMTAACQLSILFAVLGAGLCVWHVVMWRRGSLEHGRAALRLGVFSALCIGAPPLLAFAVYFCAWHSPRGLAVLADECDTEGSPTTEWHSTWTKWQRLMWRTAPLTIVTVIATILGVVWFQPSGGLDRQVTQALFLMLSAVAIPHLVLHSLAESLQQEKSEVPTCITTT